MTPEEDMRNDVSVRKVKSAVRTVELLEFLADRHDRPARIREICAALDMPRSSAHALLRTLVEAGWVRSDASGTLYGIGIRALLVGTSYLDSDPYLPLITPFLDELRAELDETFHLGRLDGTDVVYLATRESKQYRAGRQPGRPAAAGLCHRAGQGPAGRPVRRRPGRARSRRCCEPLTPHTITDRDVLDEALEEVRVRGYATDDQENTDGRAVFRGDAALHRPAQDAISASVPLARLTPEREARDRRGPADGVRQGVPRGAAGGQRRQVVRAVIPLIDAVTASIDAMKVLDAHRTRS